MTLIHKPYIGLNYPTDINSYDLLQGLLPSRGLGFLVGEPGSCKSFLALNLCAALATRSPFIHHMHDLRQSDTSFGNSTGAYASLYIAGERERGLPNRQKALIRSLKENYGIEGFDNGLPIITYALRGHAYNNLHLDIPPFTKNERSQLEAMGFPLRLIVIDTLQSALHVPAENGNTEMQYAMNRLRIFADELDCFIMVITHPAQTYGRNGSYSLKGVPRGATSMRGTADIIWHMEKIGNDGFHRLTVTKGSEGHGEGHSFYFKRNPYDASAALLPIESPPEKKHKGIGKNSLELTSKDIGVLKAMELAYREHGYLEPFHEEMDIQSVTRESIHITLKTEHLKESREKSIVPVSDSAIGNRITRALERLLAAKLILSDQLEDGAQYFSPAQPWGEMPSLLKVSFSNVNFAKVSFV